jgi:excisionase family DNA binding protein
LITSNDLAIRLGVSRATVLRAVASGLLKPAAVTPGGHRRFVLEDIERLAPSGVSRLPGFAGQRAGEFWAFAHRWILGTAPSNEDMVVA